MWPLLDILISILAFFTFKRETKRVREWRTRQHKAVNSGEYNSADTGRFVAKLRSLERQQGPSTGLSVALGMWMLFFIGVVIFSGSVLPLQPNQIPPDTTEWKIGIWFGFLVLCLIPWFFGFAVLWSGNNVQAVMENGILNVRLFRGPVFIKWDQVRGVDETYSKLGDWFFYVDTECGSMVIGHHDKNISRFADAIIKNLPGEKWSQARDHLLEVAKRESPDSDEDKA